MLNTSSSNVVTKVSSLEVMVKVSGRWMVQLPAKLGRKVRRIQCFVIFSATPMLVGRPILEMLNAVVDFGGKRTSPLGGEWQELRRGKGGARLLKLAVGFASSAKMTTMIRSRYGPVSCST